jgi:hypothetical protein
MQNLISDTKKKDWDQPENFSPDPGSTLQIASSKALWIRGASLWP